MATENLVEFGRAIFEMCEQSNKQTDRQTYIQTDKHNTDMLIEILHTPTQGEVMSVYMYVYVTQDFLSCQITNMFAIL